MKKLPAIPASFFGVNIIDLHPSLGMHPLAKVTLTLDTDFVWRESIHDGLYGPAINLIRSGQGTTARYVGIQPSVTAEWRPDRHWSFALTYAHFYSGAFIRGSGPGLDVNY
jgi:hypothetical protein